MPKVIFLPKAEKKLARLPHQDQEKVARVVRLMTDSPFEGLNVKRFQTPYGKCYRMRLGDLRLIFEIDAKTSAIYILALDYRGNIY